MVSNTRFARQEILGEVVSTIYHASELVLNIWHVSQLASSTFVKPMTIVYENRLPSLLFMTIDNVK